MVPFTAVVGCSGAVLQNIAVNLLQRRCPIINCCKSRFLGVCGHVGAVPLRIAIDCLLSAVVGCGPVLVEIARSIAILECLGCVVGCSRLLWAATLFYL